MENLVVTLETAKQLKAAGFPQNTPFVWQESYSTSENFETGEKSVNRRGWKVTKTPKGRVSIPEVVFNLWYKEVKAIEDASIAAPTAQEIADQLPPNVWRLAKDGDQYEAVIGQIPETDLLAYADTMVEALAALWLKLHEVLS